MAASTLKKKITDMAWATSSSSALITGAVAAMAEPPQMEEPTPTRVEMSVSYTHLVLHDSTLRALEKGRRENVL